MHGVWPEVFEASCGANTCVAQSSVPILDSHSALKPFLGLHRRALLISLPSIHLRTEWKKLSSSIAACLFVYPGAEGSFLDNRFIFGFSF